MRGRRKMLRRAHIVLVGWTAIAAGCWDQAQRTWQVSSPVIGGEPARADDYPSTVALTEGNGEVFCTGTLVTPRVVLTAAHCVLFTPTKTMQVIYGVAHPASAPLSSVRRVSKAIPHPEFDPYKPTDADGMGQVNDIGVIVLEEAIANARITPILPADRVDEELAPGRTIHIVGYGIYQYPAPMEAGELHKGVAPLVRRLEWEMLVGKAGSADTCNGDSGGPAYILQGCSIWLAGITSRPWAKATSLCGDGGLYTLPSKYLPWIEQAAGEAVSPNPSHDTGLLVDFCEDGGLQDARWDVSRACLAPDAICNPISNEGCNAKAGEACVVEQQGVPACHPSHNSLEPGASCDPVGLFCSPGYLCAGSFRCERLCCGDEDCGGETQCYRLAAGSGTLGTCQVGQSTKDATIDVPQEDAGGAEDSPSAPDLRVESDQQGGAAESEMAGDLAGASDDDGSVTPPGYAVGGCQVARAFPTGAPLFLWGMAAWLARTRRKGFRC